MNNSHIAVAYWIQEYSKLHWPDRIRSWIQFIEEGQPPHGFRLDDPRLSEIHKQIDLAWAQGIRFVHLLESRFPEPLQRIEDPPLVLSLLGSDADTKLRSLAVVGSRQPSQDSLNWLDRQLGQFIERCSAPIISGGAYGVDRKAHLVSLRYGNPTMNFQPSGLLQLYPRFWAEEREEFIGRGGVFVSEFLPNTPVARHHFVRRNRLISGRADAVLIVDASLRSGTMLTAQIALDQGKELFVLPGHPNDPRASGSLQLIRDGVTFVRDSCELFEFFKAESLGVISRDWDEPLNRF